MSDQRAWIEAVEGRHLDDAAMRGVMTSLMQGELSPAQMAALLTGLRMKGETIEEITAAATVMRDFARRVRVEHPHLVDTCGTGGDGARTFNISTAAAFVVVAAGGRVAKHGNRSVSSSCGSADVLEALGARIDLEPEQVAACIEETGFGFMLAPAHHPATRHVAAVRRELGFRTLFNVLGPLTNPAWVRHQVVGVYDPALIEPLAHVLGRLGSQHALVVHAEGLDEISIAGPTDLAELKGGAVRRLQCVPEDFGIARQPLEALRVDDVTQAVAMFRDCLGGGGGAPADAVALNAGAAIYVAGLAQTLGAGVARARDLLAGEAALECVDAYVAFCRRQGGDGTPGGSA